MSQNNISPTQPVSKKYYSFDPKCEVSGMSLGAILRSLRAPIYQKHIQNHGLEDVQPDQWYPLSKWMDFCNALKEDGAASPNFVSIGLKLASGMPPVADGQSYEEIVMAHPRLYHQTHRNGFDGFYAVEKISDTHFKVTTKVPYPDDLVYGSLYGEARRYLPDDVAFTVAYDREITRRDHGGEYTVIHITLSK
ncbi:MAG: hypothetical protein AAF490_23285 [Chloroflexota bacterium]